MTPINDILYFNEMPKPPKRLLFADVCHIYCSGQNIKTTVAILQLALNTLQIWFKKTVFKARSQSIIFNAGPKGQNKLSTVV